MFYQLLWAGPRAPLQVAMPERPYQQLRLVEPRGMHRREPAPPPAAAPRAILLGVPRRVAEVAIVDQEYPLQSLVPLAKRLQFPEVVLRILAGFDGHLPLAAVDDQEEQEVDRPMPGVLELLLLDGAGDGAADRATLQHLEVRFLIDRYRPDALLGQPLSIGVAPQDLLCPVLELAVQASCPPIPRAVRLQVHVGQNSADGAWADGRHEAVGDRWAGQVLTGPVGDVQA